MKRIAINLSVGLLAFALGVFVASVLHRINTATNTQPSIIERSAILTLPSIPEPSPTPAGQIVFGRDRRKIVPEEVQLKSERLRYDVGITFPQIVGSENLRIRKLNQRMEQLAIDQYQWLLSPSKEDLHYYRTGNHQEAFNSLYMDYQVVLATDSVLSIYFNAYSYGIGAAHSVQYSFVINYDLVSGKELKLARLFKRESGYLEFVSRYCTDKVSKQILPGILFAKPLAPMDANFESWNLTRDGIRFNFDECKLSGCAFGEYTVEIPYAEMKTILNTEMNLLKQLGV